MADLVFLYPDTSEGELPRPLHQKKKKKAGEKKPGAKQKHGLDSNYLQGQKGGGGGGEGAPMWLLIDGSPSREARVCVCVCLDEEARCRAAKVARPTIINRSMTMLTGM